jgi:hypothetical protein
MGVQLLIGGLGEHAEATGAPGPVVKHLDPVGYSKWHLASAERRGHSPRKIRIWVFPLHYTK